MSMATKKQPPEANSHKELSKVVLFADIRNNDQATMTLFSLMRARSFRAGETMIKEGDQGSEFFVLADGSASVYKKTQDGDLYKVAILHGHNGTCFGEGALLEADTRTATISADTDCHCYVLSAEDFRRFSQSHPEWALPVIYRVAQAVMSRLRNMNRDLSLLYKALLDEFSRGNHDI